MNILYTGRYRDPRGAAGDFRRWVFCLTSNIITDEQTLSLSQTELLRAVVDEFAMQKAIPREVLGRVGVLVPFRPLAPAVLQQIALKTLNQFAEEVREERDIAVSWDADVPVHLAMLAARSELGARNIDQQLDPIRHAEAAESILPGMAHRAIHLSEGSIQWQTISSAWSSESRWEHSFSSCPRRTGQRSNPGHRPGREPRGSRRVVGRSVL